MPARHRPWSTHAVLASCLGHLRLVTLGGSRRVRLHRHHVPSQHGTRDGSHRVRPARRAQRLPPAHGGRAVPGARPCPHDARCGLHPADRERSGAGRRGLVVLLRRRPAHPWPGRVSLCRRRDCCRHRPGSHRAPAHPGVPAPHPDDAQGCDLRGERLGGGRRAQLARRLRPDHRLGRARPLPPDRHQRRQLRRRLRLGLPGPPDRPEEGSRDSSSSVARTPPTSVSTWAM